MITQLEGGGVQSLEALFHNKGVIYLLSQRVSDILEFSILARCGSSHWISKTGFHSDLNYTEVEGHGENWFSGSRLDHPQSYWMMKQASSGFQASSYSHLSCFYAISTLVCDVVHFASHSVNERVLMLIDDALSARIHPLVKIVLYWIAVHYLSIVSFILLSLIDA